jgi:VanZ family protein
MTLIFTASGTPGQDLPQFGWMDLFAKKGGHLFGYALLGIGYLRGLVYRRIPTRRDLIVAVALACLYAATDEFHQRFTPDRSPAIQDVVIDTIGAAIGVSIWPGIRARLSKLLPRISQ